jgi:hypothetical protein
VKISAYGSRSSIHRLRFSGDYCVHEGRPEGYAAVSWGDRYGDPVWGIEVTFPQWFADLLIRRWQRQAERKLRRGATS